MKLIKEEDVSKEIRDLYTSDFFLAQDGLYLNEKYSNNVWDIYTRGIDKRSKPPLKLWFIIIPIILSLLTAAYWIYDNQGKMFFSYHDNDGDWLCDGDVWVDASVLDGLKLKKIKIDEIRKIQGDCLGLKKGSLRYSYFDLDNDGNYEIVLDGKWDNGNAVEYYLRIEKDKLSFVPINGLLLYGYSHSLNNKNVSLYWPDERNKYTFITEAVVHYSNAPSTIFRDLYHFNDQGEIELYRRETEELTGSISKIGPIKEMPLRR